MPRHQLLDASDRSEIKNSPKNFTIYKRNKSFVRPNPVTPIINRLSAQVQQLQQMVAQLESEKRMLERMVLMKVAPMNDSTAELPGIQGGGGFQHWRLLTSMSLFHWRKCTLMTDRWTMA
ncbi:hypothetical protein niasHS_008971 [Heterodera schachtii]|uniref:Uncharacterized protein n=1 Tax=Heterodera schachtii TaxID=97005 RepID=A0ABD2J1E8_HETSC